VWWSPAGNEHRCSLCLVALDYFSEDNADPSPPLFVLCRFQSMLQMALAAGEDKKIQEGLFENYLEAKVKDPHMDLVSLSSLTIYTAI